MWFVYTKGKPAKVLKIVPKFIFAILIRLTGSTILLSDAKKIEQELEHYRKLAAYWKEKTQYLSQELQVMRSEPQIAIEVLYYLFICDRYLC